MLGSVDGLLVDLLTLSILDVWEDLEISNLDYFSLLFEAHYFGKDSSIFRF